MFTELYNTEILSLSASLKNEALDNPQGTSRKVSKLCGSWVEIDVNLTDGYVSKAALRVQACALGQASAAILKSQIIGADLASLTQARDDLRNMLKNAGQPPDGQFAQLKLLLGVTSYPARHASTLLAFEAAVEAVQNATQV
ncbi:MAG: iron-sulfur cluster assembly scaffold protein [Litorimonas sp.]